MKAFISSTFSDLQDYRSMAHEALDKLGLQVLRMETFGARPVEPTTACLSDVACCDLFVGIYAHRYGFVPSGTKISITEQEYEFAVTHGKDTFCFLLAEGYPWPERYVEAEPGKSRLLRFKQKIENRVVRDLFTTQEDLAVRVATSVGRFLISGCYSESIGLRELIAVLNLRKAAILRMMDDAMHSEPQNKQPTDDCRLPHLSEKHLSDRLQHTKSLFIDLHEQNIDALAKGHLAVSHELVSQIHALLWVHERDSFRAPPNLPGLLYVSDFSPASDISDLYPYDAFSLGRPETSTDSDMESRAEHIRAEIRRRVTRD